jgi:hypothetical protein
MDHIISVLQNVLSGTHGSVQSYSPFLTGEWRKLHIEEFNDLYSSPIIIQVIKSRRMRWAGHVACMEERRGEVYKAFWRGNLSETDQLEDPHIDEKIL